MKGYTLIKDKDGKLKYYKDGQFFDTLNPVNKVDSGNTENNTSSVKSEKSVNKTKLVNSVKQGKPIELSKKNDDDYLSNSKTDKQRKVDSEIIQEKIEALIEKLKIKFSDEKIKNRFNNVLVTFFRGIRTDKEIAYVLSLPKTSGGLELPEDKIKVIVTIMHHYADEIETERKKNAYKVSQQLKQDDLQPIVDMQHRLEPPPPTIYKKPKQINKQIDQEKRQKMRQLFDRNIKSEAPIIKPKAVLMKNKKTRRLADIKVPEKLRGPVEELELMTLDEFRKAGNLDEAMAEVQERLDLLKDQSLKMYDKGIKSWKNSPLNKLYLKMNIQGIMNNLSIEKVIEKRQKDNNVSLTISEFEAINEFNHKIGY